MPCAERTQTIFQHRRRHVAVRREGDVGPVALQIGVTKRSTDTRREFAELGLKHIVELCRYEIGWHLHILLSQWYSAQKKALAGVICRARCVRSMGAL